MRHTPHNIRYRIRRTLRDLGRIVVFILSRMSLRAKCALAGVLALLILLPVVLSLLPDREAQASVMDIVADAPLYTYEDSTIDVTPNPVTLERSTLALHEGTPQASPTPEPDRTLRRGMESEEVRALQERLMDLGFLDLDESTLLYGPATEDAVKLFQRQVNFSDKLDGTTLDQDGIAGEKTLELIYAQNAPQYVVLEGMEGDDVTQMQVQLKDLGYMSATTGYYGEKTVAAIKEFQERNSLSADGKAGEYTFSLLYSPNAKESASMVRIKRTTASIDKMISVAKKQLGDRYVLGATGPDRFDCSGLVYYCLREGGSNRRRLNAAGYSQVSDWEKISSMSNLKKGDLIFFYNNAFSKVGHVGIVIGNGYMIDASSANGKVVKRPYTTSYWKKHFVCGRRPW